MLPIVTPDEMRAIDAAATTPVEILVERSGAAVARAALRMLGGAYGRRVIVIAGKGNNGKGGHRFHGPVFLVLAGRTALWITGRSGLHIRSKHSH